MSALVEANEGNHRPYGADSYTLALGELFRDLFETDVTVLLVSTGTAANALALASITPPYGAIFCRRGSHIEANEGGAVEH
jgi:threonine aldolase